MEETRRHQGDPLRAGGEGTDVGHVGILKRTVENSGVLAAQWAGTTGDNPPRISLPQMPLGICQTQNDEAEWAPEYSYSLKST